METNVRLVVIDFVYKKLIRAELQVRLCADHWTPIKTIAKNSSKEKVMKEVSHEMVKLKFRASIDKAIRLNETILEYETEREWHED